MHNQGVRKNFRSRGNCPPPPLSARRVHVVLHVLCILVHRFPHQGLDLLALLAFFPSGISYFFTRNNNNIIDVTQTDNNELFFVKTRPIGLIILKGTLMYRVNWTVGKLETPLKRARKPTRNDDKREKDNT